MVRRADDISAYIDVNSIPELHELTICSDKIIIGANTTLTEYMKICTKIGNEKPEFAYLKEIYDHLDLVANVPVRNVSATLVND